MLTAPIRPVIAPRAGMAEPMITISCRVRAVSGIIDEKISRTCKRPVEGYNNGPKDTAFFGPEGRAFEHILDN
jgi:hypothetical protein